MSKGHFSLEGILKLKSWLKANKKTQSWLAERIQSDQAHVSRLVSGKFQPEYLTMSKIHKATRGQVSFADWKRSVK